MYRPGEHVWVADLPRRLMCRVTETETVQGPAGTFQILELQPLGESWWPPQTRLFRLDDAVQRAQPRDLEAA